MAVTVKTIGFGDFEWVVTVRDQYNVDHVLEHLMRAHAFSVRTGIPDETLPVSRGVKGDLIKSSVI